MGDEKNYERFFVYEYPPQQRHYIDQVALLFQLLSQRGLQTFTDLTSDNKLQSTELGAVHLVYRHAVATIDALIPLVRLPSVEGMRIMSRAFFEAKCTLEYMVADRMEERAVAYQTQHILNRIRLYKNTDPSTETGMQTARMWERNEITQDRPFRGRDTSDAIRNLESQLEQEPYKSAHASLTKHRTIRWYSIDTGPTSFEQLCKKLGYDIFYELFYRPWSAHTHAQSGFEDSFFSKEGKGYMHAIRSLSGFHDTAEQVLPLIVDFYMKIFQKLLPKHEKRFARFYKNQYRGKWLALFQQTEVPD